MLENNSELLKSLERESAAVINVQPGSDQLCVQGVDELNVAVATSLIEEKLNECNEKKVELKVDTCNNVEINDGVKQFALKLGYDNDDIMVAALKCSEDGKAVNENTLLQELVKKFPQKLPVLNDNLANDDEKLIAEIAKTMAEVATDTTTSPGGTNTSLRDIVIDGSNVAMW